MSWRIVVAFPSLLLCSIGHAQKRTADLPCLEEALKEAGIPVTSYGKRDRNHSRLNDDLGKSDDPVTQKLYEFLDRLTSEQ